MSKQLTRSDVLYMQRVCAVCGIYRGPLDGSDCATSWARSIRGPSATSAR